MIQLIKRLCIKNPPFCRTENRSPPVYPLGLYLPSLFKIPTTVS